MAREYDVVVLGAGIAGLTAGIYLKRSSLSSVVLDKGAPGGKLNNIHRIDNYPATPEISGPDLAMKVVEQAMSLGVTLDYANVVDVRKEGDVYRIFSDVEEIQAKAVIVATGVLTRTLGAKGEKEHVGKGVSYCATCDGNFFRKKDVAVIGGKDHAIEDAIYLSGLVNKLYVFIPGEIEATEAHWNTLKEKENVEIVEGYNLVAVNGDPFVQEIEMKNKEGDVKAYPVNGVFPLAGEKSSADFLASLGVNTNKGFIITNMSMETNIPGLYAAGDIVDKRLRQIVNAAGEAAVAASMAISFVNASRKK